MRQILMVNSKDTEQDSMTDLASGPTGTVSPKAPRIIYAYMYSIHTLFKLKTTS